jgi:hypothetical protein
VADGSRGDPRRSELSRTTTRGSWSLGPAEGLGPIDSMLASTYLPAVTGAVQYKHTPDAVLLGLASLRYDPHDYIRTDGDSLEEAEAHPVGHEV